MGLLTWWHRLTSDKSVLAFRDLSVAPMDDPGLWHADGRSRLARVTRFPEPDLEKLRLLKRKADIVRLDARRAK